MCNEGAGQLKELRVPWKWPPVEQARARSLGGGTKGQLNFSHRQDEMDEAIRPGREWGPRQAVPRMHKAPLPRPAPSFGISISLI